MMAIRFDPAERDVHLECELRYFFPAYKHSCRVAAFHDVQTCCIPTVSCAARNSTGRPRDACVRRPLVARQANRVCPTRQRQQRAPGVGREFEKKPVLESIDAARGWA